MSQPRAVIDQDTIYLLGKRRCVIRKLTNTGGIMNHQGLVYCVIDSEVVYSFKIIFDEYTANEFVYVDPIGDFTNKLADFAEQWWVLKAIISTLPQPIAEEIDPQLTHSIDIFNDSGQGWVIDKKYMLQCRWPRHLNPVN
jgi:hypothetical protein